jgi:Transposase DDE domain group 1
MGGHEDPRRFRVRHASIQSWRFDASDDRETTSYRPTATVRSTPGATRDAFVAFPLACSFEPGFPIWSWYRTPQSSCRGLMFLGSDTRNPEALETRGVEYAIRIPANKNLELEIEDILFRSPGRPSRKPLIRYKSFHCQADSWTRARRVVAKVEHHAGDLFPRVGFIVTNLPLPNRAVVRFYNKRGTAEQWIKEGKQAAHWTRLSCHRFLANEVRLQLSVLAYNLGNLWRRLVLPRRIDSWSLTSLQQRLVKTGGRLVRHARYYWLLLAESQLTRRLFGSMLRRIWALPIPTG